MPAGERFQNDGKPPAWDRFVITDAGLIEGGLYDIGPELAGPVAPWRHPHQLHRTGEDFDVRLTNIPAAKWTRSARSVETTERAATFMEAITFMYTSTSAGALRTPSVNDRGVNWRVRARVSALAALLAYSTLGAASLSGQVDHLEYDEEQRLFTLTYLDDSGVTRSVTIVPPNHIEPEITLELVVPSQGHPGAFEYTYALRNETGPLSEQPIVSVDFSCPPSDKVQELSSPANWSKRHLFHQPSQQHQCRFTAHSAGLFHPGEGAEGFGVTSTRLPRIVTGRASGVAPEFPALPGILWEHDPELSHLIGQADGSDGGWYELSLVAPGRSPSDFEDPVAGVQSLLEDLARACQLLWIPDSALCELLGSLLEETRTLLGTGLSAAARAEFQTFLDTLEAHHGAGTDKLVDDNAYWLLRTNAEHVLSRI